MAQAGYKSARHAVPVDDSVASRRWVDRGLTALYSLHQKRWDINAVTRRREGFIASGTFPTFPNGWLLTFGSATTPVYLPHRLALNVALPITVFVGWRLLSGTVAWSLLRTDSGNWTGIYGEGAGDIKTSNNNSFDGLISLGSSGRYGASWTSAGLSGAGRRSYAADASATAPSALQNANINLGGALRNAYANQSSTEFTHFGVMQGALDPEELLWVANRPGSLFEPRRIMVPVAAPSGLPTLSAAAGTSTTSTLTGAAAALAALSAAAGQSTTSTLGGSSAASAAFSAAAGASGAQTLTGQATAEAAIAPAAGLSTPSAITGAATAAAAIAAATGTSTTSALVGIALVDGASAIAPASGTSTTSTLAGAATAAAAISPAAGASSAQALTGQASASSAISQAAGASTAQTLVGQGVVADNIMAPAEGLSTTSTMVGSALVAAAFVPAAGVSFTSTLLSGERAAVDDETQERRELKSGGGWARSEAATFDEHDAMLAREAREEDEIMMIVAALVQRGVFHACH